MFIGAKCERNKDKKKWEWRRKKRRIIRMKHVHNSNIEYDRGSSNLVLGPDSPINNVIEQYLPIVILLTDIPNKATDAREKESKIESSMQRCIHRMAKKNHTQTQSLANSNRCMALESLHNI